MEKAISPIGKAFEPDEGARNPMADIMSPYPDHVSSRRMITFADNTDLSQKSASQKSYKDVLSQPATSLSHRQKLLWLQKRRTSGLWVQCDDCDRWRYLPGVLDNHELPNKWYCKMNPDTAEADCSVPETPIRLRDEEDLIHSAYSAGSVVWARMPGWPWWPAMVDDCPDTEQYYWLDGFSDIPTHYNVVFFDSTDVTRGWIAPDNLKPYTVNKNTFKSVLKEKKYKPRLQSAIAQADDATKLPLEERLAKYSFVSKYKGNLNSPKIITKKELIKYQKKMIKRFNVEFPIEIESDDDNEPLKPNLPMKKRNMILLGTPKKAKRKQFQGSLNVDNDAIATHVPEDMSIVDKTPALPTNRDIAKRRIQDSMNIEETNTTPELQRLRQIVKKGIGKAVEVLPKGNTETEQTESSNDFKQQSSMAVVVGSTIDTVPATESYDNDTSKTYVPEFRPNLESTDNETEMETQEFEKRAATPNSDDFDF